MFHTSKGNTLYSIVINSAISQFHLLMS